MRRVLIAAVTAVAVPAAAAITGCGASGGSHSARATAPTAPPSVITKQQAQKVLSQYTAVNNRSNQLRNPSYLATYEAGSSYQLDAGSYRWTKSTDPANHNYSAASFLHPVFYIPQQLHYPAWFAVRAWQQDAKKPSSGPAGKYIYLIFTRSSAKAKWMQVFEPFALSGAKLPQVATDANGFAEPVTAADAQRLAITPGKLPSQDVNYLNYGFYNQMMTQQLKLRGLKPKKSLAKPVRFASAQANLVDVQDQQFYHKTMPQGSTQNDLYATTSDPIYALRTTNGGALVFYDLTATVTLGAPYGGAMGLMRIGFGGFLNGKEKPQASFQLNFGDQFAVYEPPGKPARPTVVADNSDPVSVQCGGGPCGQ
ncbi:MAG TPA: hypothetical protein VE733_13570 [Streptosporangiaceae bacterium]|nr:hypothetical protein [Streptosporangiaceae bacterium]